MTRFQGKTAIVTGAGSGLGRATAERLAAEGATVACLDVAVEAAEKTAARIKEHGGKARAYAVDVSDPASVAAAVPLADSLNAYHAARFAGSEVLFRL